VSYSVNYKICGEKKRLPIKAKEVQSSVQIDKDKFHRNG